MSTVSSKISRTAPVAASAIRTFSSLWSLEVDTKASCAPSGLQFTSSRVPLLEMSSLSVALCGSGGNFCNPDHLRGVSTVMTTLWMVMISLMSPGRGSFPGAERGFAYIGRNQVHVAYVALILLKSGDLPGNPGTSAG